MRVHVGVDPAAGARRFATRTFHGTRRQAENELTGLLSEVGQTPGVVEDGTFAELATRWLDLAAAGLSPSTVAEYRRLVDRLLLPQFGARRVRSIRAADIDAFYTRLQRSTRTKRGLSAQSVHHVHALLRRLLNQAVKWGWIVASPAAGASPPRVHKHTLDLPSPDTVVALMAAAHELDPELACFLRLSAITGARRGEICALRWTDLDVRGRSLRISRSIVGRRSEDLVEKDTKTHASRRVRLDPATIEAVGAHRRRCEERAELCGTSVGDEAFVFCDDITGERPWRPDRVTLAFARLCRASGVTGVRLHDLRHFAATQLLVAGVPVKTVAGRLGHADAATTLNVYAHFLEESDESAATILGDLLDGAGGAE